MKDKEVISGNLIIAKLEGYCPVENIYVCEGKPSMNSQDFDYHQNWKSLIRAHNKARELFFGLDNETQKYFMQSDKTIVERVGFVYFFSAFENQYTISSCWIKMVDFAKWYNTINLTA